LRIIVSADDFGYSDDTVDATIQCFERGALTSASIMANMPATKRALEFARSRSDFSYGVHLTFVGDGLERSLIDPNEASALVDSHGRFARAGSVRLRALLGILPRDQIEQEIRSQLSFVASSGTKISYVDSHKHLHKFAPFRAALARVLPDFGIRKVRNVQNMYVRKPFASPTFWLHSQWRNRLMELFETTEHFFMPTSADDVDWSEQVLARIKSGTLEVAGHPGYCEDWRAREREDLCRFAEHAQEEGHRLIGWRDL
jgi:hypothetical protein